MARRELAEADIRLIVAAPEQVLEIRPGRYLAQSIREMGAPDSRRVYLVRVVVDVAGDGAIEVVTVYRTTRIARYWRGVQ